MTQSYITLKDQYSNGKAWLYERHIPRLLRLMDETGYICLGFGGTFALRPEHVLHKAGSLLLLDSDAAMSWLIDLFVQGRNHYNYDEETTHDRGYCYFFLEREHEYYDSILAINPHVVEFWKEMRSTLEMAGMDSKEESTIEFNL